MTSSRLRSAFSLIVFLYLAFATPLSHGAEVRRAMLGRFYNTIIVSNRSDARWVVYLHGWGGTSDDVYQRLLKPADGRDSIIHRYNWIIPSSKETRSWFDFGKLDPKELEPQLAALRTELATMLKDAKVSAGQVIWAGFSQGAFVATDYILHAPERHAGLIINSGMYFQSTTWRPQVPQLKDLSFIMTHDPVDDVLPWNEAQKLFQLLLHGGLKGSLLSIAIGHDVRPSTIEDSLPALESSAHK